MEAGKTLYDIEKLVKFRREMHQFAEVSLKEFETVKRIRRYLNEVLHIPDENIKKCTETGLTVDLVGTAPPQGPNRTIAIRADIDALAVTEDNPELEYASKTGAAHYCGHDGHTTCLLGGASLILEKLHLIPSNKKVRLLFQPAEEHEGGAAPMIKEGCLDGVDEVYGYHNWPTRTVGNLMIRVGPMMSEVTCINVTIHGKGGHGSEPENAREPIIPAAEIMLKHKELLAGYHKEGLNCRSSIPRIHSGTANNVIEDTCVLAGTFRSLVPDLSPRFRKEMQELIDKIVAKYNCTATCDIRTSYPIVMNAAEPVEYVRKAAAKVFDKVSEESTPVYASEDFAYFSQARPGAFAFIGSARKEGDKMLHQKAFNFNEDVIPLASKLWLQLAFDRFELTL